MEQSYLPPSTGLGRKGHSSQKFQCMPGKLSSRLESVLHTQNPSEFNLISISAELQWLCTVRCLKVWAGQEPLPWNRSCAVLRMEKCTSFKDHFLSWETWQQSQAFSTDLWWHVKVKLDHRLCALLGLHEFIINIPGSHHLGVIAVSSSCSEHCPWLQLCPRNGPKTTAVCLVGQEPCSLSSTYNYWACLGQGTEIKGWR